MGIFLVFADGIGLGRRDPGINPFLRARLPALSQLLQGQPLLLDTLPITGPGAWAVAADACLGLPGLPQSATGQTTILTGINAAQAIGRHLNGYPTPNLRRILQEHSLFKQVVNRGLRATFLNAYRPEFFAWLSATGGDPAAGAPGAGDVPVGPFFPLAAGQDLTPPPPEAGLPPMMRRRGLKRYRPSASTVSVLAAGLPLRNLDDLQAGRAVYHDITNWTLDRMGLPVAPVSAAEAGRRAARQAALHDFTLYEHFLTDMAGHDQKMDPAVALLETLDGFLAGVLAEQAPDTTVLILSDHGNLEDLSTRGHTRHPVPVIARGPAAPNLVAAIRSLTDVTPAILAALPALVER